MNFSEPHQVIFFIIWFDSHKILIIYSGYINCKKTKNSYLLASIWEYKVNEKKIQSSKVIILQA